MCGAACGAIRWACSEVVGNREVLGAAVEPNATVHALPPPHNPPAKCRTVLRYEPRAN